MNHPKQTGLGVLFLLLVPSLLIADVMLDNLYGSRHAA